jgi:arsenate reductase
MDLICTKACATCRKAVALLDERGIAYRYRDSKKDPLSVAELEALVKKLKVPVAQLLRTRDRAYKELGLTGEESEKALLAHMAAHPGLLQRPIGVAGRRAVVGRPIENLLTLVG